MGNVDFKICTQIAIAGMASAVIGALLLSNLSLAVAKPLVRIILITMGGLILYRHLYNYKIEGALSNKKAAILGFVAGLLDTLGGGGWGPIGTPSLILSGSDPNKAVGTIEFTEPFVSLAAVVTFGVTLGFENFMWERTIPMIVGGFIITPIAGWVTSRLPKRWLGTLIGVWLIGLNIYGFLA